MHPFSYLLLFISFDEWVSEWVGKWIYTSCKWGSKTTDVKITQDQLQRWKILRYWTDLAAPIPLWKTTNLQTCYSNRLHYLHYNIGTPQADEMVRSRPVHKEKMAHHVTNAHKSNHCIQSKGTLAGLHLSDRDGKGLPHLKGWVNCPLFSILCVGPFILQEIEKSSMKTQTSLPTALSEVSSHCKLPSLQEDSYYSFPSEAELTPGP